MPSFNHDLGLQLDEDGTLCLDAADRHLVAPDTVHFAVLTTMAEVAGAHALGAAVVPASVSVQLLSRARPGMLRARARVLKKGRTLATTFSEVEQDGRLVASATVTFALLA